MKIGDLVRWTHVDHIDEILGRMTNPYITGMVVDMRLVKHHRAGSIVLKRGKQKQAQVLCKSGELNWFPVHELKVVFWSGLSEGR